MPGDNKIILTQCEFMYIRKAETDEVKKTDSGRFKYTTYIQIQNKILNVWIQLLNYYFFQFNNKFRGNKAYYQKK